MMYYEITLIVHILAVISWMAGLFYLPRVMVYHAEQSKPGDKLDSVFQLMEVKLIRVIMMPAMFAPALRTDCRRSHDSHCRSAE